MPAPTVSTEWALEDRIEYLISPSGESVLVLNKEEPSVAAKQQGFGLRQPLLRPYYNYVLNAHHQHIEYLRSQEIGYPRLESDTVTASEMAQRYGGTWTDHGTDTFAGQTLKLFTRAT